MKFSILLGVLAFGISGTCDRINRSPLTYAPLSSNTYAPPKNSNVTTLLEFVKSRSDLTTLASILAESGGLCPPPLSMRAVYLTQYGGFIQAFDTATTWSYTFFAPSNSAFNNTGAYFTTYAATAKGKWWLGNLIQHHYVPNSQLKTSTFNTSYTRIQTGSFLYVGTQIEDGNLVLNNVATVTSGDLPVTNVGSSSVSSNIILTFIQGIIHIIDRILDPSAQIFEPDVAKSSQNFIPGSCSNHCWRTARYLRGKRVTITQKVCQIETHREPIERNPFDATET